jgi:hypothetical protein
MTNLIKYNKDQISNLKELAIMAARSGSYAGMNEATLFNLMLSAADFGVSPMKAINGAFNIIKGKITMSAHLLSDRIRSAGHSIKVVEHTREKCVIIGVRKDNHDSYRCEYDMEDAKLAGLTSNDNWRKNPKAMLFARALSMLARVLFSDVVGACYSEDEGYDIQGTPPEQRIAKDPEDDFVTVNAPTNRPQESKKPTISIEEKVEAVQEVAQSETLFEPMEALKEIFEIDGITTTYLEEYIQFLAHKKNRPIEEIVQCALEKEVIQSFKSAYIKKFVKKPAEAPQLVEQTA